MSQAAYLAIAIALIVALAVFVIVAFVVLRRMKAPEGCEDIKTNNEKCGACTESGCPLYARFHKEVDE